MQKKEQHKVPIEGSLGLLALGAEGLRAWRKARNKAEKTTETKDDE